MRRLWLLLVILLAAAPLAAQTPAKARRLGIAGPAAVSAKDPNIELLRRRLGELGYREGENLRVEYRAAGELVAMNVDVIVAIGTTAALAAKDATKTIPIVFIPGADAGDAGPAQPNLTGITQPARDMVGRLAGQLKEAVPRSKRIGLLVNAKNPAAEPLLQEAKNAKVEIVDLARAEGAPAAFAAIRKNKIDALVVTRAAPLAPAKAAEQALKARLPAIHEHPDFARAGGLLAYAPKQADMYRQAAGYVVRLFGGTKPTALPVAQPSTFDLTVNLKTAKALGLTIPQPVLSRATATIK